MRTKNSIRNVLVSMVLGFIALVATFVAQRVFVNYLNIDYLGINGLFKNIMSMLAIAEVGIGSAVAYHMYKPLRDNDMQQVSALLAFYKKGFRLIALVVTAIGLMIMPFLPLIVGDTSLPINLYFVFILFIADAVFSYLMSYKRSVIYADQRNYIIDIARVSSLIVLSIIQIAILIITKNYYLYLLAKIAMTIVENFVLNKFVNINYPQLKTREAQKPLDAKVKKDIYKKMKGLIYHSVGSFFVFSTDNIVISIFFGIGVVGLYSNYLLILSAIGSMSWLLTTAITASVGNLLLIDDKKKHFDIFSRIHLGNFWVSCLATTVFFVAVNSFITLWLGAKFLLPLEVLAALSFNLYLTLSRVSFYSFKTGAGIFHEDRFVPVIESIINLVGSIILLHFFGLAGVFLGTICSALFLILYSYPKFVYKKVFAEKSSKFYKDFASKVIILIFASLLTFILSRLVNVGSDISQFMFNVFISILIPSVILFLIYRNHEEFKYYKSLFIFGLKKVKKGML